MPKLSNLNGLSQITSVGGDVQVSGTNVTNLKGLEGISEVDGNVTISFNPSLTSVQGLQNVGTVSGDFVLTQNPELQDVDGLIGLQEVEGNFEISSNDSLSDTDGLATITRVGENLTVFLNSNLIDFGAGFSNLESVFSLFITDGGLVQISQFNSLTEVFSITISNNTDLITLSGFEGLTEVGALSIIENNTLAEISGFDVLANATIFEINQPITTADSAIEITGFSNLTTIGNRIIINGLANQHIDFLSSIQQVGGNVNISNNENLADLCGLNPLVFGGGLGGNLNAFQNLYNPTIQDILNGNCSL